MKRLYWVFAVSILSVLFASHVFAASAAAPLSLDSWMESQSFSSSINLLLTITSISFIPFFLMSATSFLRIVIVLGLLRTALGTGQSPPNSVIVSLSLFLTIFIMSPVFNEVNKVAIEPYNAHKITQMEAFNRGVQPFRTFMLKTTREKDLALFMEFAKLESPKSTDDIPIYVIIPSFIISELKSAFQIAFLLFIPFVVIDLVVSNILLSLGMFMLSPVMISTPFKILLFVLTDGWNLVIKGLVLSFQ